MIGDRKTFPRRARGYVKELRGGWRGGRGVGWRDDDRKVETRKSEREERERF